MSTTRQPASRIESYTDLPTVSDWDRERLKQIVEANKQGFIWPDAAQQGKPFYPQNTWNPAIVNQPRSEDELTLNYHRRSGHNQSTTSKTQVPNAGLGFGSTTYRPLSISTYPSPRAIRVSPHRHNHVITKARSGRQSSVFDLNKILARSVVELK